MIAPFAPDTDRACPLCRGTGTLTDPAPERYPGVSASIYTCDRCGGTGRGGVVFESNAAVADDWAAAIAAEAEARAWADGMMSRRFAEGHHA
jgi:hypothetical protein